VEFAWFPSLCGALGSRIAELEECHTIVQAKIDLYAGRLKDAGVVWELVDARAETDSTELPGLRNDAAAKRR